MGEIIPFQHRFIKTGSMLVQVRGDIPTTGPQKTPCYTPELIPGKGYIYKNHVWVFRTDTTSATYPIVYHADNDDGNKLQFIKPVPEEFENWSVDKILENSFDDARTVSEDRIILSSEMIEAMNNATSSYKPVIADGDDFLKRLVKTAIRSKHVDLNRLKAKMAKSYGLSNLKSALKGSTKMSVDKFHTWMNLLGLDFTISVDTKSCPEEGMVAMHLQYDSSTDRIYDGRGVEQLVDSADDYLKRLIKLMFAERDADSSVLKSKMIKTYGFSNLMQALRGTTKMSVNGFLTWLDLLDASAEFMLYDNGLDRLNPLEDNIYYSTTTDKITNKNGEEIIIHEDTDDEE